MREDYNALAKQLEEELRKQSPLSRWYVDKGRLPPFHNSRWFTISCQVTVGAETFIHHHKMLLKDAESNLENATRSVCYSLALSIGKELLGIE